MTKNWLDCEIRTILECDWIQLGSFLRNSGKISSFFSIWLVVLMLKILYHIINFFMIAKSFHGWLWFNFIVFANIAENTHTYLTLTVRIRLLCGYVTRSRYLIYPSNLYGSSFYRFDLFATGKSRALYLS